MTEEGQEPFIDLAKEEVVQYEKQRVLLERAQRPNELWQPIRRCKMVVERLTKDGFSNIFLEPVNIPDFPDYLEYVETPMDLGTIMKKLNTRKYQGPENFARDMRKVRYFRGNKLQIYSHPSFRFLVPSPNFVSNIPFSIKSPTYTLQSSLDMEQLQSLQPTRKRNLARGRLHAETIRTDLPRLGHGIPRTLPPLGRPHRSPLGTILSKMRRRLQIPR